MRPTNARSSSGVKRLNNGAISTGHTNASRALRRVNAAHPQSHQVRGCERTTPTNTAAAAAPVIIPTASERSIE
jgi:hypothetical protein